MLQMISRRLFLGIITLFLVSVIIFTGVEILPGDACTAFLERDAHGKLLENCRIEQGLNAPAISRYVDWVSGALVRGFRHNTQWAKKNHRSSRISPSKYAVVSFNGNIDWCTLSIIFRSSSCIVA